MDVRFICAHLNRIDAERLKQLAPPFHCPWPQWAASYPRVWNASAGKALSASFVSCMHRTSGCAYPSQSSTRAKRAFSELTFQVAIRIAAEPNAGRFVVMKVRQ